MQQREQLLSPLVAGSQVVVFRWAAKRAGFNQAETAELWDRVLLVDRVERNYFAALAAARA